MIKKYVIKTIDLIKMNKIFEKEEPYPRCSFDQRYHRGSEKIPARELQKQNAKLGISKFISKRICSFLY